MHIYNFILWTNHDNFDHWALALWSYFPTPEFELLYSFIPYLYATRTPFCKPPSWNSILRKAIDRSLDWSWNFRISCFHSSSLPLDGVTMNVSWLECTFSLKIKWKAIEGTSLCTFFWSEEEFDVPLDLTGQDGNLLPLFMFNHSHVFIFIGVRIQNQIREKLNEE